MKTRAVVLSLAAAAVIGLTAGIIRGCLLSEQSLELIKDQIINYRLGASPVSAELFLRHTWKYGKDVILIFILAFIPYGSLGVYALLIVKSMSYGFTACAVIRGYGLSGVMFGFNSFGLGGLILLPALVVMGYAHMQKRTAGRLPEYFLVFLTICVCVLLVSFLEAYVLY